MFRTLLETRAPRARDRRSAAVSVVVHAGVIAAAVVATATADAHPARPERATSVIFAPPPAPTPPHASTASQPAGTPMPTVSTPVPTVNVEIPGTLPEIGVKLDPPGPSSAFTAPGTAAPDGSPSGAPNGVWSEHTVEKPVIALGDGARPRYPDLLRSAGVEGEVLAQFVVDTTGHVEPGSIRVLRSAHALFAQAVERALPQARFIPAEAGGRRVRQLVQQPFAFAIAR
jgi:protein TonB